MQDYEYNQLKKILNKLLKRYQISSYKIDRVENAVTITMLMCDSVTWLRKVFHASEILALSETENIFYREFNILWLSKAGERI